MCATLHQPDCRRIADDGVLAPCTFCQENGGLCSFASDGSDPIPPTPPRPGSPPPAPHFVHDEITYVQLIEHHMQYDERAEWDAMNAIVGVLRGFNDSLQSRAVAPTLRLDQFLREYTTLVKNSAPLLPREEFLAKLSSAHATAARAQAIIVRSKAIEKCLRKQASSRASTLAPKPRGGLRIGHSASNVAPKGRDR